MQNGEIFISSHDGIYQIRVSGRATFECAPGLRSLAKTLDQETFSQVRIELSQCQWMDSTFMGILAMIGLRAKKIGAKAVMLNAGPQNTALLCGLGLKKLFVFEEGVEETAADTEIRSGSAVTSGNAAEGAEHARMVLDAHETLMDVDAQNVPKFKQVVDLVKMDLQAQNNDSSNDKK